MNRLFSLLAAGTLTFAAVSSTARAQIPFSLANNSDGNASTQTASFGITPSAGTTQFLLTTINPAGSVPTGYGTNPADTDVANLNSYFGLANGTLAGIGAADGSGYLSQQLTLTAGSVVHFDYVFLTDEDNTLTGTRFHNDQAFLTVNGVIESTLYQASQFSSTQLDNGSSTIFSFQTPGYVTVSYTVPTTGDYTFGFGVVDIGVNTTKSGLLLDNFNYTVIPEPGTDVLLVLSAGLGGLMVVARRRNLRRQSSVA